MKNPENKTKEQLIEEVKKLKKEISEKTAESEERFRYLADASMEAIFFTKDGICVEANQVAAEMFGYDTPSEFIGMFGTEIIAPESHEIVKEHMLKNLTDEYEAVGKHRDGTLFPIAIRAKAIYFKDKGIVRATSIQDITERKQAEEILQEKNELIRNAFESMHEGILVLNNNFQYTYWNKMMEHISNTPKEKVLGTTPWKTFPFLKGDIENAMKQAMEGNPSLNNELKYVLSDGKEGYTSESYLPLKNTEGNVTGVIGVINDITLRKQAEETLQRSEERFRLLFERSPDAIFVENYNGMILDVNPAACHLHGIGRDELIGMNVLDLVPLDQRERVALEYPKWQMNDLHFYEGYSYTNDGRSIPVEIRANHIEYKGSPAMLFHVRDITERKRAAKALQESEERFRELIENASDVISILDDQGNILFESPSHTRVLGYETGYLINKNAFDYVHPQDRQRMLQQFAELLQRPEGIEQINFRFLHQDGTWRYIEGTGKNLLNSPKVRGIVVNYRDITERKQAEEALKESEQSYRTLTENMPGLVYRVMIKDKGRMVFFNDVVTEITGYRTEEMLQGEICSFDPFIHPEDRKRIVTIIKQAIKNKTAFEVEYRFIHKNGSIRNFNERGKPIFDLEGNLISIDGIIFDITERKKTQERLYIERTFSDKLIQSIPGLFYIFDKNTARFIRRNDNWKKVTGYSDDELDMMTALDMVDDKELCASRMQEVYDHGASSMENLLLTRSGELIPYFFTGDKLVIDGKTYLVGLGLDISELKQTEQALHDSEKRFKELVELLPEAVFEADLSVKLTYVNQRAYELFGYSQEDFSKGLNGLDFLVTKDQYRAKANFEMRLKGKDPGTSEYQAVKKNGSTFPILFHATSIIKNNKVCGLRGIIVDITDRKKAEEKMKELNEQLATQNKEYQALNKELNESMANIRKINVELEKAKKRAIESDRLKSAFLANMSHEIRTPMSGILGFADLLKEPNLSGEQQQNYIKIIENSGERMLNIINDLIDISKVEAGQVEINISEVNVNEQIEYIYSFFKPEIEKKGIKLFTKQTLSAKEAFIKTDREKTYAILTNLVKNAIKYTNTGSIEFGYERKGSFLEFFVKDTGIGIPKDRQQAIFDRFVQADIEDKRAFEGAGLGLSISKAYVEIIGGRFWVESQEGVGSQFYFTIPYDAYKKETPTFIVTEPTALPESQIKKLKILIAEDEEIADLHLTMVLRNIGKEILHTKTGIETVNTCRNNPDIDLILMDIKMPEMNGYEATRKIREFNKDVVIIAQTAYALTGDREKAVEAGCDDYISKPINKEELMTVITRYLLTDENKK